jgi:hypothetical protein
MAAVSTADTVPYNSMLCDVRVGQERLKAMSSEKSDGIWSEAKRVAAEKYCTTEAMHKLIQGLAENCAPKSTRTCRRPQASSKRPGYVVDERDSDERDERGILQHQHQPTPGDA